MFESIREQYGRDTIIMVRRFIKCFVTIARQQRHLYFNHRLKDFKLITPSLRVHPHVKCKEGYRLARRQSFQNLNLRITINHKTIKESLRHMVILGYNLSNVIPEDVLSEIIKYAEDKAERCSEFLKQHLDSKLQRLLPEQHFEPIDTSKFVVNLSQKPLLPEEESVLRKGMNFSIVPRHIPHAKILSSVESGIYHLPMSKKMEIRAQVSSVLRSSKLPPPNLSSAEFSALSNLKKDPSRVVLRADKGNCTIVMDRSDYDSKINNLLNDPTTYIKLKKDPTKSTERKLNALLLKLKRENKLDDSLYYRLRSTDALCPKLYGLPKLHKVNVPLRPIVSFVNSATYELSKHLCNILSPIVGLSVCNVKDSFQFAEFIKSTSCRPNDVMISCDVKSLFTTVPVSLALSVVQDRLSLDDDLCNRTRLSVSDIMSLLEFCLLATDFKVNDEYFHQSFGCPMGSPVSVVLANIVMEDVERRIIANSDFDILHWRRYVDDTWVVLPSENVSGFVSYINTIESSISFTMECENNNCISFLDLLITRNYDCTFNISLYTKPTNSNRFLPFTSHHPATHKRSLVKCMTKRASVFSSNDDSRKHQISSMKHVLNCNGYPKNFIDVNSFDYRKSSTVISTNTNKVVLPYVKNISEPIARILRKHKIQCLHKPVKKICDILKLPKDQVDHDLYRGVVYKIPCDNCDRSYVGQTGNSFQSRVKQHQAALRLLNPEKSALAEHAINEDHAINWNSAEILCQENNYHQRLFLEAWHAKRNVCLNRCDLPISPLYDEF